MPGVGTGERPAGEGCWGNREMGRAGTDTTTDTGTDMGMGTGSGPDSLCQVVIATAPGHSSFPGSFLLPWVILAVPLHSRCPRPFPFSPSIPAVPLHSRCPVPFPFFRSIPVFPLHSRRPSRAGGARPDIATVWPFWAAHGPAPPLSPAPSSGSRDPGVSRSRYRPPVLSPHGHTAALTLWADPSLPPGSHSTSFPRRATQELHS